jgi:hypothetical protein
MQLQNLKVIINGKAFDVDGYSISRQIYFLLDGRTVGFEDARRVIRGTGVKEYDYHKNGSNKEIFEGDTIKFFDEYNHILTGAVVWCEKRLQWIIECDANIHGWKIYTLADAGLPTIMQSKY